MAFPVAEKTYEFLVNQSFGGEASYSEDHRAGIFKMKQMLLDPGFTHQWTVAGSGDGVSFGMDGIDRWIDQYDLIWGETDAQQRSWIVFNTVGGRQLMIECRGHGGAAVKYWRIRTKTSPSGSFTGGGATSTPSAPDEQTHLAAEDWLANQSSIQTYRMHLIRSTDGESQILLACFNGYTPLFFWSGRIVDPVAGFTHPYAAVWPAGGSGSSGPDYGSIRAAQQVLMRDVDEGENFAGAFTCEGFLSDAIGQEMTVPNYFTGEWPMVPIGVAASQVKTGMGRHGRVSDIFFTSTSLADGDTLEANPATPTREWAVFGDMVFPWNGTIPLAV